MSRKTILVAGLSGLLVFIVSFFWWRLDGSRFLLPGWSGTSQPERLLLQYSFPVLSKRQYKGSEIKLEKVLKEEEGYAPWLFSFQSDGKRVTGMANLPKSKNSAFDTLDTLGTLDTFPVVVMLRGYADDEVYFTGLGTRKAAGVFAQNGFITLAPDFLGFGGSEAPAEDILAARFEKPVTVLNLLASIKTLSQADPEKIFLWGHSNGGQIALSVLEISGRPIPTALWAPVTKGFPESVLDYIGEMDDQGKKVTDRIFEFEKYYDQKEFSVDTYFDRLAAPLQIQQGGRDWLVKQEWTDEFVKQIKELGKGVTYYSYPNADHNLEPSWDTAVSRDLDFFRKFLR